MMKRVFPMDGIRIEKTINVALDLTEQQWYLYNMDGAAEAAKALNQKISALINSGDLLGTFDVLIAYRDYGAYDHGGYQVLERILDMVERS